MSYNQTAFTLQPIPIRKNVQTSNYSKKKIFFIISIVLLLIGFVAAITLTLLFVLVFNKTNCAANSTKIGDSCVCNYGFSGDGINYCDECGVVYQSPNVKIVGGIPANEKSWPSAALLVFSYKEDVSIPSSASKITISFSTKCGGTLLNRNTILTAAHCILKKATFSYNGVTYQTTIKPTTYYPSLESMYKIYLGVYNISVLKDPFSVSKIVTHESYSDSNELNDIAILKLSSEASLSESIQVTCLPNPSNGLVYPINNPLESWAIGWGALSYLGSSPDILYNVNLTIYNETMCSYVSIGVVKNWQSQICAGEITGGKDTCQGDSGGSLFIKDKVNGKLKYVTVGIVSYGDECAKINSPGIYTRVSYYNNWIKQHL